MVSELGAWTWPEVAARAGDLVLVVPIGSTEQHGPHLPLATDTAVAVALAHRLAAARTDVVVAPALPYGSSGEHAGFPGTLSIGQTALQSVIVELGRSADDFAGMVVVSGHGGNAEPLTRATAVLVTEGRRVRWWAPAPSGDTRHDAHAGWTETSVMLALSADNVRVDLAAGGTTQPISELIGALRSGGVAAVSANGVLGDPTGASPADGRRLLDGWAARLQADLDGWP